MMNLSVELRQITFHPGRKFIPSFFDAPVLAEEREQHDHQRRERRDHDHTGDEVRGEREFLHNCL